MEFRKLLFGREVDPVVVAEMSGNHNHSLERALKIVDAAADAGADAIKLQTYTPDTMTLDLAEGDFTVRDPRSLWFGETMYSLYARAHTPWEWHEPIMKRASERGIACFSSPFDESAIDFLESLGCPVYKIASLESVDLPLIRKAAGTGKPLIISTGMATISEIAEAVEAAREAGCRELMLLHCTSSYPAEPRDANLRTIGHMRELFGCEVGLSDHSLGIGVAVAAVALGARVVEKHFTLSRSDEGVDSEFSLEPQDLAALVTEMKRASEAVGEIRYGPNESEITSRARRRSLYIGEDMKKGDIFTPQNLRRIRPGHGLAPKYYEELLGRPVITDVSRGTPVSWSLVMPTGSSNNS